MVCRVGCLCVFLILSVVCLLLVVEWWKCVRKGRLELSCCGGFSLVLLVCWVFVRVVGVSLWWVSIRVLFVRSVCGVWVSFEILIFF